VELKVKKGAKDDAEIVRFEMSREQFGGVLGQLEEIEARIAAVS
jgi:hypothetical protein